MPGAIQQQQNMVLFGGDQMHDRIGIDFFVSPDHLAIDADGRPLAASALEPQVCLALQVDTEIQANGIRAKVVRPRDFGVWRVLVDIRSPRQA